MVPHQTPMYHATGKSLMRDSHSSSSHLFLTVCTCRYFSEIKFGALFDRIISSPSQWLATGMSVILAHKTICVTILAGHYAQIAWAHAGQGWRSKLMRAKDPMKDQTYYLASVAEAKLRQVRPYKSVVSLELNHHLGAFPNWPSYEN